MARALAKRPDDYSLKFEKIRRQRYGCMLRLFRARYGRVLPDDSAGREDLWLLIQNVSLVPFDAERRIRNTIQTWAPWMSDDETEARISFLMKLTTAERSTDSKELGLRFNVTNAERVALQLWQIHPVDMTDDDLTAWRKQRERDRRTASRRANGVRSREQYLAELKSASRPWEAEGISKWQYYRKRRCNEVRPKSRRGVTEINSLMQRTDPVAPQQGHPGSASGEVSNHQQDSENGRGTHQASRALRSHRVAPKDDLARVREEMEARAREAWIQENSRGSIEKGATPK